MSWSDDDWDAEEALAQAKKKDDSDELDESSEEEKPKAVSPKPKPKPKAKKEEGYVPLADPVAEKLRRQKLIEEEDAKLTDDLFSGCAKPGTKKDDDDEEEKKQAEKEAEKKKEAEKNQRIEYKYIMKDSMEDLQMKRHEHIDTMTKLVAGKLKTATANNAKVKFIQDTLKEISGRIELGEMEKLQKSIKEAINVRKKAALEAKKKKNADEDAKSKAAQDELLARAKEKEKTGEKLTDEEFFAQFM